MKKFIVEADIGLNDDGTFSFARSTNDPKEYDTYGEAATAARVQQQRPGAYGFVHYRVGSVEVPEPVKPVTVYVVDLAEVEKRVLIGAIPDADVQKLLPFQTSLGAGKTYAHIVNESAYTIYTNYHEIVEGDTICGRNGGADWQLNPNYDVPTCPGCLAKAKRIIVEHILRGEHA